MTKQKYPIYDQLTGKCIGWNYCPDECATKKKEIEKHEEIKNLAEKLLIGSSGSELLLCMLDDEDNSSTNTEIIQNCWKIAEEFYNMAKEKQGEKL